MAEKTDLMVFLERNSTLFPALRVGDRLAFFMYGVINPTLELSLVKVLTEC